MVNHFGQILAVHFAVLLGVPVVASDERPDWADSLPQTSQNLIYVGDLKPHFDRILDSKVTQAALETIFTKPGEAEQLLSDRRADLAGSVDRIPKKAVVAIDTMAFDVLGQIGEAVLKGQLALNATSPDDAAQLRQGASQALRRLAMPRVSVWVEFRSETLPRQAIGLLRAIAATQQRDGLTVDSGATYITLSTTVGAFAGPGVLQTVLGKLGVVEAGEYAVAGQLATTIARIPIRARLEREGAIVRCSIGDDSTTGEPAGSPSGPRLVPTVWSNRDEQIVYAQWDARRLVELLTKVESTWDAWRDTPAGEAVLRSDSDDMLGDLSLALRQIKRAGEVGAGRLVIADRLLGRLETRGHSATPALQETGLQGLIPRDGAVVLASSCDTLADWFSDQLSDFEDRMAKNSLKAELKGEESKATMLDQWSAKYYRDFAAFRELIHRGTASVFDRGFAAIGTANGRIDDFEALWMAEGFPGTFTIKDATFPAFALVGKASSHAAAQKYYAEAWTLLLNGMGTEPQGPALVEADLGISAPTFTFAGPASSLAGTANQFEFRCDGDPTPHIAFTEDWVVFSTSRDLTRRFIERSRQSDGAATRRTPELPNDLVSFMKIDPKTVEQYFQMVADAAGSLESDRAGFSIDFEPLSGDEIEPILRIAEGFARVGRLCKHVKRCEWRTRQAKDLRRTDFVLEFGK